MVLRFFFLSFHENGPRFVACDLDFPKRVDDEDRADGATGPISRRQGKRASQGIRVLHHRPRQLFRRSEGHQTDTCENDIFTCCNLWQRATNIYRTVRRATLSGL